MCANMSSCWPPMSSTWCGRSQRPTRRRATTPRLTTLAADVHRLRCWLDAGRRRGRGTATRAGDGRRSPVIPRGRRGQRAGDGVRSDAGGALGAGGGDAVGWSCRCDRPGGEPARRSGAHRVGGDGTRAGRRRRRRRRWTRSPARSATSPAGSRAMRACATTRSCGHSGRCAGGGTAKACATPRSASTPKPTPASRPCSTPPSPPNEPSPTTAAPSTSSAPTPSCTLVTATPAPGARRPAELLVLCDLKTMQRRPSRDERLRDVRRPTTPTSNGPPAGLRSGHHPDRVGRRRPRGRRRTSQTPRHRRSTTSPAAPCTERAPHPTAPSASVTATSTTSQNGTTAARRTSRT